MASLLAGRGLTVLLLLISIVLVYLAGVNLDGGQQVNVTSSKEVLPLSPNVAVANVTVTKVAVPFGDLRLDHLAQVRFSGLSVISRLVLFSHLHQSWKSLFKRHASRLTALGK